jgi:hypothetical protein
MTETPEEKQPEEKPDEMREVKAAVVAALCFGLVMLGWVVVFRVMVPAIIDSHIYGSVFLASITGLFGGVGVFVGAMFAFQRIGRWLK